MIWGTSVLKYNKLRLLDETKVKNSMSRATVVLILFAVIIVAIIGVSQFLQNQPPIEITIAVNPMAEGWVNEAATAFNNRDVVVNNTTRVRIRVVTVSDMRVWQNNSGWSTTDHPDAWLPASTASINYINGNLSFEIVTPSAARTPLLWGGFDSRVDVLTNNGLQALDWDTLATAVANNEGNWASLGGESSWGFLKLAYPRPSSDISGLAVLFSGAGAYTGSAALDRSALIEDDFNEWMQAIVDSVPNFQTLGSDPASVMAARGTSVAEIAILPETLWLNSLADLDNITFHYPQSQFILDFPLAIWNDTDTSDDMRLGVQAFADQLMSSGQTTVAKYGLRPATTEPKPTDTLFSIGEPMGIMITPDYGQIVEIPDRNTAETLLERFG